jgi:hypothetical protein
MNRYRRTMFKNAQTCGTGLPNSLDIGHLLKGPVHVVRDGFDLELLVDELVLDLVNPNDM